MKNFTEGKHSSTETQVTEAHKIDAKTDRPRKFRRFCFFLKHVVRLFAIIGCFVGCSYFLIISTKRLNAGMILQEFEGITSVGDVNLQITVCPVAPFEQVLALDFRTHTRRANNLIRYKAHMAIVNRPEVFRRFAMSLMCMYRSQYVHPDEAIEEKLNRLRLHPECQIGTDMLFTPDFPQDILEIHTWIRSYILLYLLDLHKEGDVDFYKGIYKNIDILEQDNATLPEFLNSASRDLEDYVTSDFTDIDNVNLNNPIQKVLVSTLKTRFGQRCTSYTLASSEEGKKLNQRYALRMTFNRVDHAYILVFVNENRTFSDIPGASVMQPYRIPLDTSSVLHVRRIEKTTKNEILENCRVYDRKSSPGSRVECMEACLLKKVVTNKNITCLMPWMTRNSTRGLTTKPFCNTYEDYLNTRQMTTNIFRSNTSDCNNICAESCEKLNILVRRMGIVRTTYQSEDERYHVEIIVSNEVYNFKNRPAYGWGEFTSEMFGSLSFILGIAFVALIDWIFASLLWLCGKLPYIPAMPPLINSDLYVQDIYYHVRHELCGDPIPLTISQAYLKTHEHRRDAYKAAHTPIDQRQPHFPRVHQRVSSFAIMSEAIATVSQHHHETPLQEQLKHISEALSRQEISVRKSSEQISAYPLDVLSQQRIRRTEPHRAGRSSMQDMPAKWSEPRIKISGPDEVADDARQESPSVDTSALRENVDSTGQRSPPADDISALREETDGVDAGVDSTGQRSPPAGDTRALQEDTDGYDAGEGGQTADKSSLPGIERERRPSRAASVLRDLEAAEASRGSEAEEEPPPLTPAAARERRRSSTYRTKPRRKSHAVAPAPDPEHKEENGRDEPPD